LSGIPFSAALASHHSRISGGILTGVGVMPNNSPRCLAIVFPQLKMNHLRRTIMIPFHPRGNLMNLSEYHRQLYLKLAELTATVDDIEKLTAQLDGRNKTRHNALAIVDDLNEAAAGLQILNYNGLGTFQNMQLSGATPGGDS
jgi:hypothetical protein